MKKQILSMIGFVVLSTTMYAQQDSEIVNIPDANFKNALLANPQINKDNDSNITYGEARGYTEKLDVSKKQIESLVGIEAFVNIKELEMAFNNVSTLNLSKNTALERLSCTYNELTTLDLSANTALKVVECGDNKLTQLNVTKNIALERLYCRYNQLSTLDLTNNLVLQDVECNENRLTQLDLSKNSNLRGLWCDKNQLTSIDLTHNPLLRTLNCAYNRLTELDLSQNKNIQLLECNNNQITRIDISMLPALSLLYCNNNKLTYLNIANGVGGRMEVNAMGNPNLACIQVDNGQQPTNKWLKDDTAQWNNTGKSCEEFLPTIEVNPNTQFSVLNPVAEHLLIKGAEKIEKVEIYNTAGQLVKVLLKGNTQVSDLNKGVYLIKIITDKATTTQKIIKK